MFYIKTQYEGNDMKKKLLLLISMLVIGTGTASALDTAVTPRPDSGELTRPI